MNLKTKKINSLSKLPEQAHKGDMFDLFANEDEFEDWVEEMWDWFNTVEEMTPEQVELIEQLKLDRLYKETIM